MIDMVNRIHTIAGTPDGVHSEALIFEGNFLELSARFSALEGTVALLSGGELDCARYHIIGVLPWLKLTGHKGRATLAANGRHLRVKANPLDVLRQVLSAYDQKSAEPFEDDSSWPLQAGLLGYLSYDLKDSLEKLPRTSFDDLHLPHLCLYAPSVIAVHDKAKTRTRLYFFKRSVNGRSSLDSDRERFYHFLTADTPPQMPFYGNPAGFKSNFTRRDYEAAVARIRNYIAAGDVYQVNFSQRFEMEFKGSAFQLFEALFRRNPAPFFAYVNAGSHQVVSTSPERFIQQQGRRVEARPIKGTRPRGGTSAEDRSLAEELVHSQKDDAELSMIVDLLRNDIGKVCRPGTVCVSRHKKLESYKNVHHLVSIVEGQLDEDFGPVDLIEAAFPGGSITGCPKIRAMEIIDEMETCRRHIYTGSVGYIGFHDSMDLSIAIRTATVVDKRIIFSVGGGIVYDSDPAAEYEETMHKGKTLMSVFEGKGAVAAEQPVVWINGALRPFDQARIGIGDLGLQYGFGFFETIRVDSGSPRWLNLHLARFYRTWRHLFGGRPADLSWKEIILAVIRKNGLEKETAAVKLLATAGSGGRQAWDGTLCVTARPYQHRLTGKRPQGLHLACYPHPRQTPLSDHKTLNYLYYHLAGRWAAERGADEALILNADKSVSECNTANLLLICGKRVILPESLHRLAGVMEKAVCRRLRKWGYTMIQQRVFVQDLYDADDVLLTNSLIGTVPALSVDGRSLISSTDLWRKINESLSID